MPETIFDPAHTALVVIDLQKGIVGIPTEPHAPGRVVENTVRIADALRARGGWVVWVRVAGSADGKDMLKLLTDGPSPWAANRPADWTEPAPGLGIQPQDHVITKRQWGAFYGTDLDLQLRRRGITTIILCGISTMVGVESTARDAFERGYQQIFVEDAMAAHAADDHKHTVESVFPRMGRVRSTEQVLAALT